MADQQVLDQEQIRSLRSLIPEAGNPRVGTKVFELLSEVIDDKITLGLHQQWLEFYKLGRNKHWSNDKSPVSLISANLLHTHRQRTVNTLTDNDPAFQVSVMLDQDMSDSVTKLQRLCEYWWTEEEQSTVYEESVRNGETYGVTIEKSIFDTSLNPPFGEVRTVLVDPYYFGIYPVKAKEIQDAEACFYYYPMNVREVRRRWPDKAAEIKADSEFLEELGDERREIQAGNAGGFMARLGSSIKALLSMSGTNRGVKDDEVLVCECWVKDRDGDYPGGIRCIIACSGGKIVLEDKPNPSINPNLPIEQASQTYLYHRFPFAKANSIKDPVSFWGASDFEQLSQLQKEFDKALSQMVFLKDKAARPKVVNPKDSGVANEEFTNVWGIINPSSSMAANGIRYLDFPNMPVDVEKIANLLKDLFFLVAGTFELENAQTPGREVVAHRAIAALIEHAATMMRGKIRSYSRLLRERGRMYLSHVQNWYTEDRIFSWEQAGQTQVGTIRNTEVLFTISLTVLAGSTLPASKTAQREEATQLFQLGAIDQEDLLEKLDWSNRDDVVERMKSGPYGEMLSRMQTLGMPPQLLQVIQQISQMDAKEFEQQVKAGQVPPLQLTAPEQQQPDVDPMQNAELQLAQAKVMLEQANRALLLEKVNTERVDQQVKLSGVQFDQQKLAIERAATLGDIEAQRHGQIVQSAKTQSDIENAHHQRTIDETVPTAKETNVRERGLQSNNQTEDEA